MKTPWICRRLGVEVGKWFTMRRHGKLLRLKIKEDGTFETDPPMAAGASEALLRAIENPDMIGRKPLFEVGTLAPVDTRDMLTLGKMFPGKSFTFERQKNGICVIRVTNGDTFVIGPSVIFQFVRPGCKFTVLCEEEWREQGTVGKMP